MDVSNFTSDLLSELARLDFVERVELETEAIIVRGRAYLQEDMFIEIYFNERTNTTAFALIKEQDRIWGIDRDAIRGWHEHPFKNPNSHVEIKPVSIAEIISKLRGVYQKSLKISSEVL